MQSRYDLLINVNCHSRNSNKISGKNISSLCCLIKRHLGSFLARDSSWRPDADSQNNSRSEVGDPVFESFLRDTFETSGKTG